MLKKAAKYSRAGLTAYAFVLITSDADVCAPFPLPSTLAAPRFATSLKKIIEDMQKKPQAGIKCIFYKP